MQVLKISEHLSKWNFDESCKLDESYGTVEASERVNAYQEAQMGRCGL